MPSVNAPVYSLNGGEVGDESLSRLDLERLQFAGSLYSNMLPRVVGSMTLRPGLEHIADIDFGDVTLVEYSYSGGASLLPILSHNVMRVLKDNAFVSRVAVNTMVPNGDFATSDHWLDVSTGTASIWAGGGMLQLSGSSQGRATARQSVAVSVADQWKEHGLRIEVSRGPVDVRIGSTVDGAEHVAALALDDGTHSLAFTPGSSIVFIEIASDNARAAFVTLCQIDDAGVLVLPTPWTSGDLAANILRYKQSKDKIYTASGFYQQREIQRRSDTGWGVQRYRVDDGPFTTSDGRISLQPSGYTGNVDLVANRGMFSPAMLGRLFRLFQSGQYVLETFSTSPAAGDYIRISGVGSAARAFGYTISGTWSGTLNLQAALDDGSGSPGAWTTVASFTANDSTQYWDTDDNVVKFFRFQIGTGGLTSGTVNASLGYGGGSRSSVVRMTGYHSPTSISVEVLSRIYSLDATFEWDYSTWSDFDGWPSAVETFGGRLYWGHGDIINGSIPDAYKSFDDSQIGDSSPIARSIGSSTQRGILWLLGLQRLLAGTDVAEISVKSSSFDEPLTADSWFPVSSSTRGCENIRSVVCDKDGIFVQTSKTRIFNLRTGEGTLDYGSFDLTAMHEHVCDGSEVVDIAVQRQPDTVVWFILANGEARALTYEPGEKVIAWSRIITDGDFKRVAASRSAGQDNIYFAVVRNGTQRLERLANLNDCRGGAMNCLADGFARFTAEPGQTAFPVPHLAGRDVTVWVGGHALHDQAGLYRVEDGVVWLPPQPAGTAVVIGLPYAGRWQSTKLAYGAANGTALFQKKRVSQLGLYLVQTCLDGLRVGKDFATLRRFTTTKSDKPIAPGQIFSSFDADMMSVSSDWDTDSRLCLEARSPYPFTAASLVMDITTHG